MEEESITRNFLGYIYFLLNSDDGNIYVLSLITGDDGEKYVTFLPKDEEIDPEVAIVGWSEDSLQNLMEGFRMANVTITPELYDKQDELLPVLVRIHRDKITGKSTLTFDDNF